MPIILSAGSISLTIEQFTEFSYPREAIEVTGVTFSAWGTPATDGTSYEPKCIWNLVALLTFDEAETLARLAVLSRSQDLLLIDRLDRVWETGAPTRAIAPGTTAELKGGMVGYFAQFKARITAPLKQQHTRVYRRLTVQLTETTKVPPI